MTARQSGHALLEGLTPRVVRDFLKDVAELCGGFRVLVQLGEFISQGKPQTEPLLRRGVQFEGPFVRFDCGRRFPEGRVKIGEFFSEHCALLSQFHSF